MAVDAHSVDLLGVDGDDDQGILRFAFILDEGGQLLLQVFEVGVGDGAEVYRFVDAVEAVVEDFAAEPGAEGIGRDVVADEVRHLRWFWLNTGGC